LIAGERRWRAAQRAGLTEVPVTVQDLADDDLLEVALLENIQRQDLNPIEEALAYQQLLAQYGYAQEDLAKVVAKSRSHVTNLLRLLNLPSEVQQLVRQGKLSMGHARALVTADDPLSIAKQIMDQGLSVRATERLVQGKELDADEAPDREAALPKVNGATSHGQMTSLSKDADAVALEQTLCDLLGTRVNLKLNNGRGAITIQYDSLEKLDFLLKRLTASGI
jgi:ParB family chromosome partitioning protein